MTDKPYLDVELRHDFLMFFDVMDGNPNGDPDAGNLPRMDPETMHGLVTDVCLKRKVRNYVHAVMGKKPNYKIYVQQRGVLANEQKRAFEAVKAEPSETPNEAARRWMCRNFFDIRLFGAVMTTGKAGDGAKKWNCGQVRGPVQVTFARSLDPIVPMDMTITRVALTNPDDIRGSNFEEDTTGFVQMGRKSLVPYGVYKAHGFFTPHFAKDTGASPRDLEVFWAGLVNMWDFDRTASHGLMSLRGLYVFTHGSPLGNAPAHRLFELVKVGKREGVSIPRKFGDYDVRVDEEGVPPGVTLSRLEG